MNKFYCVVTGANLNEEICDELLLVAYQMASSMQRKRKFRNSDIEGYVTTKFKRASMGTLSGILFTAYIDGVPRTTTTTTVTYILRPEDFEDLEDDELGAWLSLEELESNLPVSKDRLRPNPVQRAKKLTRSN